MVAGWWWSGVPLGLGNAELVRAACRHAVAAGVLRFEADVQARNERFFAALGWAPSNHRLRAARARR